MYHINVPESIILSKVNTISLKGGVGITGQRKCVTYRLAEGRSEGGRNLRKIPLIPEWALAIHWRHQVDLRTK